MVEEITLPVEKVDIIVSEWMGYALLYEAMLDSVLSARDKWLGPEGLMIPSEISLHMALLADPELIVDKSDFWSEVYGFDMRIMRKGVFEGAMIEVASSSVIPSDLSSSDGCNKILHLDLHKAAVNDLTFHKPFQLKLNREIDALDGFVVWFDAIFGRPGSKDKMVTLSTGPLAKRTHWQQVKLVIDRQDKAGERLPVEQVVQGSIEYSRPNNEHRNLEITIDWSATGRADDGRQHWKIDY
jgi:type I protein arginine methyltransferase